MIRLVLAVLALALVAAPAPLHAGTPGAGISGAYVEARTCDVWTGPCFANAEVNLGGKNAVLGWKIDKGTLDNVKLDGLGVVAVIAASDTLGVEQTGPGKAVLIVDRRASAAQRDALIRLAKRQAGDLLSNIIHVESADVDLEICPCKQDACAVLKAGGAKIETACLDGSHKICGNESAFYPPLTKGVAVKAALAVENSYTGKRIGGTWNDHGCRSAYVGTFKVR